MGPTVFLASVMADRVAHTLTTKWDFIVVTSVRGEYFDGTNHSA